MALSLISHIRADIFGFSPVDEYKTFLLGITDEAADHLLELADGVTVWDIELDESEDMFIRDPRGSK